MEGARSPPAKKHRRLPAPSTYLSLLDEESADNVVRFMSRHPKTAEWRLCVAEEDMLLLFSIGGQVSISARCLLKTFPGGSSRWSSQERVAGEATEDEIKLLKGLSSMASQSFREMNIEATLHAPYFSELLPNLEELYVYSNLEEVRFPVIPHCQPRELSVSGCIIDRGGVDKIIRSSHRLEYLRLDSKNVQSDLRALFSLRGGYLKELALKFPDLDYDSRVENGGLRMWLHRVLPSAATYCKSLRSLTVWGFDVGDDLSLIRDCILGMVINNSKTLRVLNLDGPVPLGFIREVAKICPSLDFRLFSLDDVYADTLLAMGSTARSVFADSWGDELLNFEKHQVEEVCTACVNLSLIGLNVKAWQHDIFTEFFKHPHLSLKKVDVEILGFDPAFTPTDMFMLVASFRNLEFFRYEGKHPEMQAIEALIAANEGLERIGILLTGDMSSRCECVGPCRKQLDDERESVFSWVPALKALRLCKHLKHVSLKCTKDDGVGGVYVPAVADALIPYRNISPFEANICRYMYE